MTGTATATGGTTADAAIHVTTGAMHNPPVESIPAPQGPLSRRAGTNNIGALARSRLSAGDVGGPVPTSLGRLTLDRISSQDGTSSTLWVLENDTRANWLFGDTFDLGIGALVNAVAYPADPTVGGGQVAGTQSYGRFSDDPLTADGFNFDAGGADVAKRPRPSSEHNSGVITAGFCDGRASSLAETIDRSVYLRLLSSGGSTLSFARDDTVPAASRGLSYQGPISDSDYAR